MNATILESHIAAALGRDRTPIDGGRTETGRRPQINVQNTKSAWATDYGAGRPTIKATGVDAARLAFVSGGDHNGSSGAVRENRMVNGSGRVRPSLWTQVNSHLCAGTKVFAFCLGVVAFIVVV